MEDDALQRALKRFRDDFKDDLTEHEQRQFRFATRLDLDKALQKIQIDHSKKGKLTHLRRIQAFLEAFDQYAKILDLFANANDFVPFVWGPVKFLLQTASNYTHVFDTLLDAYKQIGDCLPILGQHEELFRHHPQSRQVLELLYGDIIEFHWKALRWFRKNGWQHWLKATWKTFETTFRGILENIKRHRDLLDSQANLNIAIALRQAEQENRRRWTEAEKAEESRQRGKVNEWLRDTSETVDIQQELVKDWKPYPESGQWLFEKEDFKEWFNPDFCSEPFLWITGSPGAGKTILASKIVDKIQRDPLASVVYFYFKHGDEGRNTFKALVRSMLFQMLKYNSNLLPFLVEELSTAGGLSSRTVCKELIRPALESMWKTYIILDGLDECPRDEETDIIKFFLDCVAEAKPSDNDTFRLLFVGQNDDISSKLLGKRFKLVIQPEDNSQDIRQYTQYWGAKIQPKFGIRDDDRESLENKVQMHAGGMFLYAKLVLENCFLQRNRQRFFHEIEPAWFPKGIQDAYERIKLRVFHDSSETHRDDAWKVLELLVHAQRALKWREIQGAFAIDVDEQDVDFSGRHLRDLGPKDLCSSLVEWRSNDSVELVHTTAKEYLLMDPRMSGYNQNHHLASLCLVLLGSEGFSDDPTSRQMSEDVAAGNHAFLDYAVMYWPSHIEKFISHSSSGGDENKDKSLKDLLGTFLDSHFTPRGEHRISEQALRQTSARLHMWADWSRFDTLLKAITATKRQLSPTDASSTDNEFLDVPKVLGQARVILEELSESIDPGVQQAYGSKLFKCSRMNCARFFDGYGTKEARDQHEKKHEKPFFCTFQGCDRAELGFATGGELRAHLKMEHGEDTGDDTFATRRILRDGPEDDHPAEIHEVKHEFKFPCSSCDRKFTRKENLIDHENTHRGNRPHQCKYCRKLFTRLSDKNRHEEIHTGKKKFICNGRLGGEVDNLDSWGCGREFNRLHQLTSHYIFEPDAGGPCCIQPLMDQCIQASGTKNNTKKYLCSVVFLENVEDYVYVHNWGCKEQFTKAQMMKHWKSKLGRNECLKHVISKEELPLIATDKGLDDSAATEDELKTPETPQHPPLLARETFQSFDSSVQLPPISSWFDQQSAETVDPTRLYL